MRVHFEKTAEVYRATRGENPGGAMVWCSAAEAKELTAGQRVALRASNDREVAGKLVRLDPQAHAGLGQIEALIEFADPSRVMAAGTFVTATFADGEARSLLAVPASALLDAADGCYVYAVNGNHLTRTRVKVGPINDGFVGIEDGLYSGDSVATRGVGNLWLVELSALKGGTPCCPVPKKDSAK
jgi:multidrug efflux pump subunit AcrA (membrane-fusion protein)